MLEGEDTFRGIWITASFKEGEQVWWDDDFRVELYPDTPVHNLQAEEDEELLFFIDVPSMDIEEMIVETSGGGRSAESVGQCVSSLHGPAGFTP